MGKSRKSDLYREARAAGKSYARIAKEYGVSYQSVWEACRGTEEGQFRAWTPERCIYPNLRKWLNDNRVSLSVFIRRLGLVSSGTTSARFGNYFKGECYPTKKVIDGMLQLTGLTYEQLWATEES